MASFSEKFGNADVPHREIYGKAVSELGYQKVRNLLPWSDEELQNAYERCGDTFNAIPLRQWDRIAGYSENPITGDLTSWNTPLKNMLINIGVNCFSCSQLVSVLKECARQVVERQEVIA